VAPEAELPPMLLLLLLLLQSLWADMADGFKTAVDSFTLVDTTNAYIPPDQNPW
jgi:hypothetical protein